MSWSRTFDISRRFLMLNADTRELMWWACWRERQLCNCSTSSLAGISDRDLYEEYREIADQDDYLIIEAQVQLGV